MPALDPYPYISYITAAGDEVILSCDGYKKWWECYGREGFAAPPLECVTRQYADGMTDTLAVIMKPRTLSIQMVINGDSCRERDVILADMASRLIQVGSRKNWGTLKVKRSDGSFVLIDCVYAGGMDEIVHELPYAQQFTLSFFAGNAYFYDIDETVLAIRNLSDLVYLNDDLLLSDDLYLTDGISTTFINNSGESFYPIVEIIGPASVIRVTNDTTGQVLEVDPDLHLLAGQKLTFDCREHERAIILTNTDDTETDITQKLALGSSLVWEIVKGSNSITFYYTDSNEETFARIRYHQRYLSA